MLRTLEGEGLVGRAPDPVDSRVKRGRVTEAGEAVRERAMYAVERAVRADLPGRACDGGAWGAARG
ncbi:MULTISPECIES: helix-turn-helix domain-containing protein [Kitasatospora]|uniref:HTH marR-type domain-containing protein n=1 Tax=Kitasatospora cathayae TaxID=3004092 RepID=A0ABY7QBD4_9ACTN|nr:hypothetical protein [Kitasatospora sp. HUAS 3-15]WBP89967.1 hypothetical protein O1G21_31735 [Kitasatospora sp. HUAS 3-15]